MTFLKGLERFTNWIFLGEQSGHNLSLLQNGAKKECVQVVVINSKADFEELRKFPNQVLWKKNFNVKQIAYL